MSALFVTATGTDVGKTFIACALIRALRAAGRPVDAFKPVLSGYDGPEGSDAARLLAALNRPLSDLARMSPLRFSAPLAPPSAARAEGRALTLDQIAGLCIGRMSESDDLLLIEGAGGIMSPLAEGATNLDLAIDLDLPVLLVTGSYLGAVSHALTAIRVIQAQGLSIKVVVISESEGENPPLSEAAEALAVFAPDLACILAPRDANWGADKLAALV